MHRSLSQILRVGFLIAYVIVLLVVNALLFKEFFPTGLWFWSAFLALLLSEFISQPFFTAPKDAVSNSIAAISTIFPLLAVSVLNDSVKGFWIGFLIVSAIVLLVAIFAMVLGNSARPRIKITAEILTRLSGVFGKPKVLFTAIFFLSLATFHNHTVEVFWLSLTWIVVVLGRPLENLHALYRRIRDLWDDVRSETELIGQVVLRREPGLITIRVSGDAFPDVGKLVLIPVNSTHGQLAVILDHYRLSNERWSRALVFSERVPREDVEIGWGAENTALSCGQEKVKGNWLENDLYKKQGQVIGSVIERSDVSLVRIELYKDDLQLFEGQLISININGQPVLYQIINGVTDSELLQQSNRHGFMSIEARKLGCWNSNEHRFDQVSWTPSIYSPVFLVSQVEATTFCTGYIGYVPRTDYGIKVNCGNLVTHNTAILGVLGSGKTSLALELIRRMVNDGIKVCIIDITGQYEPALGQLVHLKKQNAADNTIRTNIASSASTHNQSRELGGNHKTFATSIRKHIDEFLQDDTWRVRVLNPHNYEVTEQTSGVFNNSAGFGRLTITQITRIVAEELLNALKNEITEKARLCLVLEEAHSLVPEWNSVAHDGDRNATNGTAKAILQGRKYGFGCLLITQRTANVTKSILNQCNTIFSLRVFDATGMDFLSNYIGSDYASLLATLPPRHCVAFGRGLNTQNPLIVELNHRDEFNEQFSIANDDYLEKQEDTEPENTQDDDKFPD